MLRHAAALAGAALIPARLAAQVAKLETVQSGPKEGSTRFSGLDGACKETWAAIGGAVAAFVELSGGKDVRSRVTSGGGDSDTAEIVVSWS